MILIVDANILIGELLRRKGQELIQNPQFTLYITEKALNETHYELRQRISSMVRQGRVSQIDGENFLKVAQSIIAAKIERIPDSEYSHLETEARNRIPRDPNDWETVAAALLLDVAIWTQDCDFLGCGCPTWTTETLRIRFNYR
jgi:predicted nucleic acid-binding protein